MNKKAFGNLTFPLDKCKKKWYNIGVMQGCWNWHTRRTSTTHHLAP